MLDSLSFPRTDGGRHARPGRVDNTLMGASSPGSYQVTKPLPVRAQRATRKADKSLGKTACVDDSVSQTSVWLAHHCQCDSAGATALDHDGGRVLGNWLKAGKWPSRSRIEAVDSCGDAGHYAQMGMDAGAALAVVAL